MPRLMPRALLMVAAIALLGLLAVPLRVIAQGSTTTPTTGGLQIGPTETPTAAGGATPSTGGLVIGPTPTPAPKTGVHGNSYTSPTYGFTLGWSSRWHVVQQSSKGGVDQLTLSDGTATVVFATTTAFNGDVSRCSTASVAKLKATSGVTDVKQATDPSGKVLGGTSADRAWSVQLYARSGTAMTRYIDCRVLVPNRANLVITADIPLDKFNAESPQLLALLAKLTIVPSTVTPAASPVSTAVPATKTAAPVSTSQALPTREIQPTSQATAPVATTAPLSTPVFPVQTTSTPGPLPTPPVGQATVQATATEDLAALGVHGNTYKSPNYGFTLSWDSSWTVGDANSSRGGQSGIGFDQLTLYDAASAMTITGSADFNGNAQACVQGVGQALQQAQSGETIANFKVASGSDGKPLQGGTATDAWAVYLYTRTQSGQSQSVANYVECRTLVAGKAVLVIVQDVNQSDYNSELGPRQKLLATLKIPPQSGPATTPEATPSIGK